MFGAWALLWPKVRPATPEEIRAACPPDLLAQPKADPAAQARYNRLVAICQGLRSPKDWYNDDGTLDTQDQPAVQRKTLAGDALGFAQATRLLREGPLQRPWNDNPFELNSDFKEIKKLADLLFMRSEVASDEGTRIDSVVEGLEFANAVRDLPGDQLFYLTGREIDAQATRSALKLVRSSRVSEEGMSNLLHGIPTLGPIDQTEANDTPLEFQKALRWILILTRDKQRTPTGLLDLAGNLDAIGTTQTCVQVAQGLKTNALRDWRHQDDGPAKIVNAAEEGLTESLIPPSDTAANWGGEESQPDVLSQLSYVFQMNRVPNTIGRNVISMVSPSYWRRSSVSSATMHEIVRSVIAIHLFEARHGSAPKDLDELVSERYLSSVPMDWFAGAPLRYDPNRRLVYSLGPSCIDHHGTFDNEMQGADGEDFGAYIDPPPPHIDPHPPKPSPSPNPEGD